MSNVPLRLAACAVEQNNLSTAIASVHLSESHSLSLDHRSRPQAHRDSTGDVFGRNFPTWTLYMQIGLGWTPLRAGLTGPRSFCSSAARGSLWTSRKNPPAGPTSN